MSFNNDRDPIEGTYRAEGGARAYGPACGAGELRGLLQRIADHIANADERQQSTLGEMQTRLAHLVERWPTPSKPYDAEDRGRWPESPHDDPLRHHPVSPPQRERSPYQTRGLGEAPPPLKSAAAHSGYGGWDHRTAMPADSGYARPRRAQPEDQGGEWDRASAEALTRIYEPDDAGDLHGMSSQPPGPESDRLGQGFRAELGSRPAFESNEGAREQRPEASDRLELRFAEIADRVEQGLAQLDPDASAAHLDARFATFEKRIGSALADLATRADVEQLRAFEVHIEELGRHIERTQSRLARIDEIEVTLMRLVEQTSDEHVVQLIDQQVLSGPRLARLADAVAAHLAERDAFRGEVGAGMDRLRELYALIEQFVVAQRQGDQQTASALEVIQQAVLNLLDRMESLEHTYDPAPRADGGADAGQSWQTGHWDERTTSEPRHRDQETDPYALGVVSITDRTKDLPSPGRSDASEGAGAETRIASSIARGELPGHFPPTASESLGGQSAAPEVESTDEQLPLHKSREDFLAAARRAARKASSEAAEDAASARAAGRQRRRATSIRPVTGLVVAVLAVVLVAGIGVTTYSIYKDGLRETWGLGRGVWELGRGASGVGSSAGGASASEGAHPAAETPDAGPTRPASRSMPGVIIDDPAGPRPPETEGSSGEPRKLTGLPGGVVIDTGIIASAARAGEVAAPAAYTPRDGEALPAQSGSTGQGERAMPPAAVGPLSLRLAAANGDPSAEFEVAVRLDEGRGIARDPEKAVVWYRRSAAQGFAPAQYRLGTLYERGLGVAADRGRAMAWYRSAAEKGNVKAMHNFAVLSAGGESAGFPTAAHWFGEAAGRGLVDSQYNLAVLYETGRGVEQDLKQAYKWFALAARGGDKEAAHRRDRVRWMLDAGELEAAEALADAWRPEPLEPQVNDIRAAGEAWKRRDRQD